jgi:diphthine methyl ester acylhydrolase
VGSTHVVTQQMEDAILDAQWAPHADRLGDLLAVATSTGRLVFYRLDLRGGGDLVFSATKAVSDPSILVLSLAWHPWRAHVIGFTLSDGCVCLCESTEGKLWSEEALVYQHTIQRHELEAWMLAFSGPGSTNVLSGGDDGVLQYSTLNSQNERRLQWHDRKLHHAGITAILPLTADLVVTGSYDDHIRLIHVPPTGRRRILAELNLEGGVWRLKAMTRLPCREGMEPEITRYVQPASTKSVDLPFCPSIVSSFPCTTCLRSSVDMNDAI